MAAAVLARIAEDLRNARRSVGVSQRRVAHAAGLTQSGISRTERNVRRSLTVEELARHATALGLRLSVAFYPAGTPVRDRPQLRLLTTLRELVHARFRWRSEAAVGSGGDLRAWDVLLTGPVTIAIDAETRIDDVQAVQRRVELKRRDSNVDRVVLLIADTRHNREVVREFRSTLLPTFPLGSREILAALRDGTDPGGDGILFLRIQPASNTHAAPGSPDEAHVGPSHLRTQTDGP